MRKKDLLAAAVDRRMDGEMMTKCCQMIKKKYYSGETFVYRYGRLIAADIIEARGKQILQVSVWNNEKRGLVDVPKYHVFLDREDGKHMTWELLPEKWRKAQINNLDWTWYLNAESGVYESADTKKVILKYLGEKSGTGYEAVEKFQGKAFANRKEERCRAEIERIDAAMALVPPEPKGFREWAFGDGMEESMYIYYHYEKQVREGYCTNCRKIVPVDRPKHNKKGFCRCCNRMITFKSAGKAAPVIDDAEVLLLQKLKDGSGYVLRRYSVYRRINRETFKRPTESIREKRRHFLGRYMRPESNYTHDLFRQINKVRWCNYGSGWDSYERQARLYPDNLQGELAGTELKYIPLWLLLRSENPKIESPIVMLFRAEKYPEVTEYLIKCGLYALAREFLKNNRLEVSGLLDTRETDIRKALHITGEQLKILRERNAGTGMLRLMERANMEGVRLTEDQLNHMYDHAYQWQFIEYMKNTTPHKMLKYLDQCTNRQEYLDYLGMRRQCGYDMADTVILYPRDLKTAHDRMVMETNRKKEEQRLKEVRDKYPHIEEQYGELSRQYAYTYRDWLIRPAMSAGEIVLEGRILHHCVGSEEYLKGHDDGKSIILMLRKKEEPDTPWYTVEYNREREKIVQWYSEYDKKPDGETVKRWLNRWEAEIRKRNAGQKVKIAV